MHAVGMQPAPGQSTICKACKLDTSKIIAKLKLQGIPCYVVS